ncbi:sensory neuron membrane protein 2-like [Arctopsyche grandis]|uniref:sensory neuron membrane protein 2-like n=1 Tax=Arctopsyche grandis TaxID=121162 RepID=UPI00406D7144
MGNICKIVLLILGLVLAVLGIVLGWAVFPVLVEKNIVKSVVLEKGSEAFERWEEVPFPVDFKVYIFNITNGPEVIAGGKPNLTEVGPYIYKQYRYKVNITDENGTLGYHQYERYEFDEEKSDPLKETDPIEVLNVPFNAILQVAATKGSAELLGLSLFLKNIFMNNIDIVISTTIENLLFKGIKICEGGSPKIPCDKILAEKTKTMRIDVDGSIYISMFNHKNMSHDGRYLVQDGTREIQELGRIMEWEGSSTLGLWPDANSTCNMINGTDSTIYSPFVDKAKTLDIFNSDICRSVRTRYKEDISYKGIQGFRYVSGEEMFAAPSEENENMCFCLNTTIGNTQPNGCLKKGTIELFSCLDSHIVLSYPHFLYADEDYQTGVTGLSPDEDLHQIFLDIEPNTGTPLRGGKRAQFNMFLRNLRHISTTSKLTSNTLLPFLWVDEGIELPDEFVDYLNDSLFSVLLILEIVKWVLIGVGLLIGITFTTVLICGRKKKGEFV